MIVKHFDVKPPKTQPPEKEEGWEPAWHASYGYYAMTKCVSPESQTEWQERDRAIRAEGKMPGTEFFEDCFLSVLADIKREHVNMFELGAGWGRLCLAVAGVVDYRVIPLTPVSYRCLAVEGEPTHCQWIKEHFEAQNINGTLVYGAVANRNGSCRFLVQPAPDVCYGQAIVPVFSPRKVPILGNIYSMLKKKNTIKIPMYTVDRLITKYDFDHVDFICMDIQGAEYKAMLGAAESIKNDLIDYLLIGTHDRELNDSLRTLLCPKFDLIVDIYPRTVGIVDGFLPVACQDGIQLYKRKNI